MPPGEQHDLSLIAFGLSLREHGWRITYLGADTPIATIAETATTLGPSLIVVSAVDPTRLSDCAQELRDLAARFPLALAGAGADEALASQTGATHLLDGPVEAAELVGAKVGPKSSMPGGSA